MDFCSFTHLFTKYLQLSLEIRPSLFSLHKAILFRIISTPLLGGFHIQVLLNYVTSSDHFQIQLCCNIAYGLLRIIFKFIFHLNFRFGSSLAHWSSWNASFHYSLLFELFDDPYEMVWVIIFRSSTFYTEFNQKLSPQWSRWLVFSIYCRTILKFSAELLISFLWSEAILLGEMWVLKPRHYSSRKSDSRYSKIR